MNNLELNAKLKPAVLVLAEGSVFSGYAIGASGHTVGEVVFNTAMTGYQEILTDPSYAQQLITFTYPHIGNVGINPDDNESAKVWAAGLIIRELSLITSNWRARQSLAEFLREQRIIGIAGIDTRKLTRIIREQGAQHGCIMTDTTDSTAALEKARAFSGIAGIDLVSEVSTKKVYEWQQPTLSLDGAQPEINQQYHVVVCDFGVKYQMLRLLKDRGCKVTVVPANYSMSQIMQLKPDGILLSNGPGDPAACQQSIKTIQQLIESNIPLLGICMGFQLLALALGAKTVKMKFGHHGANHPVKNLLTETVVITSQNHGFSVDEKSLPDSVHVTHRSLFDNTIQGFKHNTKPIVAFQGHPEASPGPHDVLELFDEFMTMLKMTMQSKV